MVFVERWRAHEISLKSTLNYDNPFLDAQINAVFTSPSGRKIKRDAYWDGEDIFKISFAPTEIGRWDYIVSSLEGDAINGLKGSLQCVEYQGEYDIYRHGFLKVAGQGKYLSYYDDTPFFWLGDTHWGFISGERWDESNYPPFKCQFKGMVDKRVEQGFTVYQTNLRVGYDTHYWVDGKEGVLPDLNFYKNVVDPRMKYIADRGLVNALGFGWSGQIIGNQEMFRRLTKYIVARYGALPIVWTLAGEVAGYIENVRQQCIDEWRKIALLIEEIDDYNHLQTAHYTNERPFADYYQNEHWFDFTLNQAGHGDFPISAKYYKNHIAKYPNKPFIEGEAMYEGVLTLEENGSRDATPDMIRRIAYMSIQCGGCGYTYGAQGIWDAVWDKSKPPKLDIFGFKSWIEGIEGKCADQLTYMRSFYERVRFWEMRSFDACYKSAVPFTDETLFGLFNPLVTATLDMSRIIAYFTARSNSGNGSKLTLLKNSVYTASWFNPRNGEYLLIEENLIPIDGQWEVPPKPSKEDWLLLVEEKLC
jgi:hypothetical protein